MINEIIKLIIWLFYGPDKKKGGDTYFSSKSISKEELRVLKKIHKKTSGKNKRQSKEPEWKRYITYDTYSDFSKNWEYKIVAGENDSGKELIVVLRDKRFLYKAFVSNPECPVVSNNGFAVTTTFKHGTDGGGIRVYNNLGKLVFRSNSKYNFSDIYAISDNGLYVVYQIYNVGIFIADTSKSKVIFKQNVDYHASKIVIDNETLTIKITTVDKDKIILAIPV